MPVYKDNKTNTWRAVFRYTDWTGEKKQTQKRGFITQRAAKRRNVKAARCLQYDI